MEEKKEHDLSMDGIINAKESDLHVTVEPDENGNVNFSEEQLAEMFTMAEPQQPQINPYTHELNFDAIKSLQDVIEVLRSLKVSIDPEQWEQDQKYIKLKGE